MSPYVRFGPARAPVTRNAQTSDRPAKIGHFVMEGECHPVAQQTFYQPSKGGWFCLNYLLCLNSRFNCRLTTIFIKFYIMLKKIEVQRSI